ncbi:hypothetical protein, partial [Micromonospora sp. DT47]|uniref:hypothetical protein n=1 Tax=Micromonospora sp. DT47 TaxID=3393431 RepID=UPI003CE6C3D5
WLIKHPVEFSKNNHTPPRNPTPWSPDPGHFRSVVTAAHAPGTFTTLPGGFSRVKPLYRGSSRFNPNSGHHNSTGFRRSHSWLPAGRPLAVSRTLARFPAG